MFSKKNNIEKNDLIEKFLSQEFTPKVKTYYRSLLKPFEKYLHDNNLTVHTFEEEHVRAYYDGKMVREEWVRKSVYTFLTVLKSFCIWNYKDIDGMMIGKRGEDLDKLLMERVRLNKIIDMKKPRIVEKIKSEVPVTIDALRKIFMLMIKDKHNHNKEKYAFKRFWFVCWFGCRVGELVEITPDMITLDENKIHFITEKTVVERVNFYDDFTKQFLEEYLQDNGLINVTEQAYWSCLKRYTKMAGQKVYPKLGREAWNTNMKGKIDDNFVKVVCGHSIKGLRDISEVYRFYPPAKIKEIMTEKHYLIPLEEEMQELLDAN